MTTRARWGERRLALALGLGVEELRDRLLVQYGTRDLEEARTLVEVAEGSGGTWALRRIFEELRAEARS